MYNFFISFLTTTRNQNLCGEIEERFFFSFSLILVGPRKTGRTEGEWDASVAAALRSPH
jgi:hypothetical protein